MTTAAVLCYQLNSAGAAHCLRKEEGQGKRAHVDVSLACKCFIGMVPFSRKLNHRNERRRIPYNDELPCGALGTQTRRAQTPSIRCTFYYTKLQS